MLVFEKWVLRDDCLDDDVVDDENLNEGIHSTLYTFVLLRSTHDDVVQISKGRRPGGAQLDVPGSRASHNPIVGSWCMPFTVQLVPNSVVAANTRMHLTMAGLRGASPPAVAIFGFAHKPQPAANSATLKSATE